VGRLLILAGVVLIFAGVAVSLAERYTSLGRLPGDLVYRRGNFSFYFPVVTSILLSLVLTLVVWLLNRR
jgi:hypothetical protein